MEDLNKKIENIKQKLKYHKLTIIGKKTKEEEKFMKKFEDNTELYNDYNLEYTRYQSNPYQKLLKDLEKELFELHLYKTQKNYVYMTEILAIIGIGTLIYYLMTIIIPITPNSQFNSIQKGVIIIGVSLIIGLIMKSLETYEKINNEKILNKIEGKKMLLILIAVGIIFIIYGILI